MSIQERFLLHFSDRANWRLRNLEEHPFDPRWEIGTYSVCHDNIRPLTIPETKILDVVVKDGKPVIRSAFVIRRVRGNGIKRALYFDDFYFSDGNPIELPGNHIQYRCMTMEKFVSKYHLKTLWRDITEKYTSYKKGQRPRSIDPKSWNHMVKETSKIRIRTRCKRKVRSKRAKGRCK